MADEPSNGELARRLDRIEALLVSRNEHTLALGHLQSQIKDLDDDIKSLRAEKASRGMTKTTAFYGFLGTVAGGVILAALTMWIQGKGGH